MCIGNFIDKRITYKKKTKLKVNKLNFDCWYAKLQQFLIYINGKYSHISKFLHTLSQMQACIGTL